MTKRNPSLKKFWCPIIHEEISSISKFFEVLDSTLQSHQGRSFWFRGHSNISWELKPAALRFGTTAQIDTALEMYHDFKRLSVNKLERAPSLSDELPWLGIAQHYGIPTRFLDWTQNPAVALYFAVNSKEEVDGCVYLLNPFDLNFQAKKEKRIFDSNKDREFILKYLNLGANEVVSGKSLPTIAINPTYNSDRILLQRGAFTLHGNKPFSLDVLQAPSLICIPILKKHRQKLKEELGRIGIDQMSIFPEVEHISTYLKVNL